MGKVLPRTNVSQPGRTLRVVTEQSPSPKPGDNAQGSANSRDAEAYDVPDVHPAVAALDNERLGRFREKVRMIIDRRIEGIHYAERRRQQTVTQMGAVVAVGLAVLPLLSGASTPVRYAYTGASLTLAAGGLITWVIYANQTNPPYAFLGPARARTWFYRQALPDLDALEAAAARSKEEFQRVHDEQFEKFADVQAAVMSEPRRDASDDLRQLFLLHQNEMTKNRQLTLLSRALSRTITVALLVALFAGVMGLIVGHEGDELADGRSTTEVDGAGVTADWRATGTQRTMSGSVESELVVEATVTNNTSRSITVTRLIASDADDRGIPLDAPIDRVTVAPGEALTVGPVVAWTPRSLIDDIHTLRAA